MIDIHSHLDDERLFKNLDEIIKNAKESEVKYIIAPGIDLDSSKKVIEIVKKYENIFAMIGIHPSSVEKIKEKDINELENLVQENKIIGIGEIGLDYTYNIDKLKQQEIFIRQLEIAKKYNLPVLIHIRESFKDVFELIKNFKLKFIWHSFTGSQVELEKFLSLESFISISGIITFKNAKNLREIVKLIPLTRILIETDSPYLTPEPFRGKINQPAYVKFVYQKVSEIKKINLEELIKIVEKNFKNIFNLI